MPRLLVRHVEYASFYPQKNLFVKPTPLYTSAMIPSSHYFNSKYNIELVNGNYLRSHAKGLQECAQKGQANPSDLAVFEKSWLFHDSRNGPATDEYFFWSLSRDQPNHILHATRYDVVASANFDLLILVSLLPRRRVSYPWQSPTERNSSQPIV